MRRESHFCRRVKASVVLLVLSFVQPLPESFGCLRPVQDLIDATDLETGSALSVPLPVYSPDELVNISVYEQSNRSVVNIQTAFEGRDAFLRPVIGEGSGSGWVFDDLGHVVTNFHVVKNSDRIAVTMFDGEKSFAQIIGVDIRNDIAVLKVDVPKESLIPLALGDSSLLKVGQKALAIGSPFGLDRTLTVGIVSSLNRTLESQNARGRTIKSVIQIDAALNQGNSGGPLFDSRGLMIGMNTAIASANQQNAQNSGVGFAVPANTIQRIVPQLISHGKVIRATAGIHNVRATTRGLMIVLVEPGGPAEKARLRGALRPVLERQRNRMVVVGFQENPYLGDLIQSVDGVEVSSWDQLQEEIEKHDPGDTVTLSVFRERRTLDVSVKLDVEE